MIGRLVPAACVALLLWSDVLVPGQAPAQTVVVTNGGAICPTPTRCFTWPQARVFKHDGPTDAFAEVWQSAPLGLDRETAAAWTAESVALLNPAMLIADWDKDGANDLLFMDQLGITVYGRAPAYFPFADAFALSADGSLLAADVDADGRVELITQRGVDDRVRRIEVWQREGTALARRSTQDFSGSAYGLVMGDVDNDGTNELLTASDTILVLKPESGYRWRIAAELPNIGLARRAGQADDFTLVDVVRIADVDRDGQNEIIASGNSGMVTVYKHRKQGSGRESYPVLWQSPYLAHADLQPSVAGQLPMSLTQGLAIADLDSDGHADILVGTMEFGRAPAGARGTGHLHLFTFDGLRGFREVWLSDWVPNSNIPGLVAGDLYGDGRAEFVHNGSDVYSFDATTKSFQARRLCDSCSSRSAVIGSLGPLKEPESVRLVPVRATVPRSGLPSGIPTAVELTLRSVWAGAQDVHVTVTTKDEQLSIAGGSVQVPVVPAGSLAVLPPVTFTAKPRQPSTDFGFALIDVEITAAGGYRQTIQWPVQLAGK